MTNRFPYRWAWDFDVVGDGVWDDTANLQKWLDWCVQNGTPAKLPPGRFRTTDKLRVGISGGGEVEGFSLIGSGRQINAAASNAGSMIFYDGAASISAVLEIEPDLWRHFVIGNLGVACTNPRAANYGLLFNDTAFSADRVAGVGVFNTSVAYGIVRISGGNGENTLFHDCSGHTVDKFFYGNSGQAYVQRFDHSQCFLRNGGTYFHLDNTNQGFGLDVTDFNATGDQGTLGVSNTTLLNDAASSSPITFSGGRVEALTRLYANGGSSSKAVLIDGMQFACDADPSNTNLMLPNFIDMQSCPDFLGIRGCNIEGATGQEVLTFKLGYSSTGKALFEKTTIGPFKRKPVLIFGNQDTGHLFEYKQCNQVLMVAGSRVTVPLEYRDGGYESQIGQRQYQSNYSGTPSSLMVMPQFIDLPNGQGHNTAPASSPWVHTGAASAWGWHGWNDGVGGWQPQDSSAWARRASWTGLSGIYQDFTALDLSTGPVMLFYQGRFREIAGDDVVFTLEDTSGSGIPYDEHHYQQGTSSCPHLVTLQAYIPRTAAGIYPRLRIQSKPAASQTAGFVIQSQFISTLPDAVFPASSVAVTEGEAWNIVAGKIRAWDRFALPVKSDYYGKSAVAQPPNRGAEPYISAETGQFRIYNPILGKYQNITVTDA